MNRFGRIRLLFNGAEFDFITAQDGHNITEMKTKPKIKPGDVVNTPKGAGVVKKVGSFMAVVSISNKKHRFLNVQCSVI